MKKNQASGLLILILLIAGGIGLIFSVLKLMAPDGLVSQVSILPSFIGSIALLALASIIDLLARIELHLRPEEEEDDEEDLSEEEKQ